MVKDKQIRRFYDFGEFRLDTTNRRLTRNDGEIVSLTPREFELLLALILNAGETLAKDALLREVWKDAFVSEETLTRNVSFLRKKLGGEQFIETVPKIGYRFVADVSASDLPEIVVEEKTLTRFRAEEIVSISDPPRQISETEERSNLVAIQDQRIAAAGTHQIQKPPAVNLKPLWLLAGVIVVAFGVFLISQFYFQRRETKIVFASPAIPFSGLPGYESMPSFSPDSRQIAFAWNGGEGEVLDVYVKIVGGAGEPFRLTRGDRNAMFPVFTADGKYVAFFRSYPEASIIYQVPALGGAERKIAEVSSGGTSFSFSPDGKTIAVGDREKEKDATGIFLVNIETGAKQRLTTPPENFNDHSPRFSPDGKQIVFVRAAGWDEQDLFIASSDTAQTAPPHRLTFDRSAISGLSWTADGKSIMFSSKRGGTSSNLWRIAPGSEAELVMIGGKNPQTPVIAPNGKTLAFVEQAEDANIWRYEINSNKKPSPPRKFFTSSRAEHSPVLSPNGRKIAFVSDRTGENSIWIADADGSNLMNLVAAGAGAPRFSPDGKRLVFAAKNANDAHTSIFVASIEGGAAQRLTDGSSDDSLPAWSADGRWIYFRSNRGGDFNIWKMPASANGEAMQITRNGGFEMFAAPDDKEIYYTKEPYTSGIWRIPANGGEERPVPELSEAGQRRYWTLSPNGIYYLSAAVHPPYKIMFYDFKSRQTGEILTTNQSPLLNHCGLSVSADGKTIFYVQHDQNASSIMLTKF